MHIINPEYTDFEQAGNEFQWNIPPRFNIARAVCDKHRGLDNRPALLYERLDGTLETYTFGDLRVAVQSPGERFGLCRDPQGRSGGHCAAQRIETGIAHIAIHKSGAISQPLSILFGPEAVEFIEEMPMTTTGKVRRLDLRNLDQAKAGYSG